MAALRCEPLDFKVLPGEIVGIVGQNGAGKTTLTKLLNGLLKPAEGNVVVAGLNTREVPTSRIARHVSTLFQNPDRQICKDTVLDEVAFGLLLQGVSLDEASARAKATCERFGLPLDEAPVFAVARPAPDGCACVGRGGRAAGHRARRAHKRA